MKKLPGVYEAYKKDKTKYYRASITVKRKHISLGSYKTSREANLAYELARQLLSSDSITIQDYKEAFVMSFEKWVSIINLRDNGIYISNPIYIESNFFFYYFSPTQYFIFDRDDLFYYSSHKISKRGGHYFVADYGMQINIMSRYGIKNYAVINKDYRFKNGNTDDFRYENIEIINRYTGVFTYYDKGFVRYKVKIHVKGNYIVGTYDSEIEAAIAYNKAIDALKSKGIKKNYSQNYIESISAKEYAEIYSACKISEKLK